MNPDTLTERALALYEKGQLEQSKILFKEVIGADSQSLEAQTYLGRIAARQELITEACFWLAQAASNTKAGAQVHFELGCFQELQAHSQPELTVALTSYTRATELDVNHHAAFFNKANIHKRLGQIELALQSYNAAIFIYPLDPFYFNNRGDLLLNLRSLPFALKDFEQAIELDPSVAYFHDNRANALKELKLFDLSSLSFKRSLAIEPENALTYNNFGSLFLELDVWDKALACFEMALRIEPSFFYALYNKGLLYQRFNLLDKALECYEEALSINPASVDALWNKSIIHLSTGDLKRGLVGYEERWRLPENRGFPPKTTKPKLVKGTACQRLLIWNEHGVGNEIFFANFLRHPDLKFKQIIAKFDLRLHDLLKHSFKESIHIRFISEWTDIQEDQYDAHLGMGSLPYFLGIDTPPAPLWGTPFLRVKNQVSVENFRNALCASDPVAGQVSANSSSNSLNLRKLVVGISWKSVNQKTGARRSIKLEQLLSVFKNLPIQLVNLQYGDVRAEIEDASSLIVREAIISRGVEHLSTHQSVDDVSIQQFAEVDNFSNITGLAELITACDLIVSIDNSTLHLASALGRPTCALIPFVSDWRWFLQRTDTPWYQHTKLYRQIKRGCWVSPLELLRTDLQRVIQTR